MSTGTWYGVLASDGVKRVLMYKAVTDERTASRGRSIMVVPTRELVNIAKSLVPELPVGVPARVALDDFLTEDHPTRSLALNSVWNALVALDRIQIPR